MKLLLLSVLVVVTLSFGDARLVKKHNKLSKRLTSFIPSKFESIMAKRKAGQGSDELEDIVALGLLEEAAGQIRKRANEYVFRRALKPIIQKTQKKKRVMGSIVKTVHKRAALKKSPSVKIFKRGLKFFK